MGMLMHRHYLEANNKGVANKVAPKVEKAEKEVKAEKPKKKED